MIERITSSDIQRLNELDSDDDDSNDSNENKKDTFKSNELCQGLIIVSDSDAPSDDDSTLWSDYSSDETNNSTEQEDADMSYNESIRQSRIMSLKNSESLLVSPSNENEERSFCIPVDFEDRFITLRIKDGSLTYFHVDGQNLADTVFERDNDNDNSLKDYELYPIKKVKIIKSAKSVPLSSISLKKSTQQSNDQQQSLSNTSSYSLFFSNSSIDFSNQNSSAYLLRKMTLTADCGKETKN